MGRRKANRKVERGDIANVEGRVLDQLFQSFKIGAEKLPTCMDVKGNYLPYKADDDAIQFAAMCLRELRVRAQYGFNPNYTKRVSQYMELMQLYTAKGYDVLDLGQWGDMVAELSQAYLSWKEKPLKK